MNGQSTDIAEPAELMAEVARLRAQIAQLRERVEQLDELAHQDTLVAMPNRRGFERELERVIDRVARYRTRAAMLYVDVDGLKMINDSFGHQAGDQALIEVARLLSSGVRRSDVVARIGGDEFAVILENADSGRAQETARRLSETICGSEFVHDGDALPLSVAIGVGVIETGDRIADIVARADADMYRGKAAA